jgi:hypothetical protein
MRRSLVVIGMTLTFALATCLPANAYILLGPRWAGQPAPPTCCAQITYRNIAGQTRNINGLNNGAYAWSASAAPAVISLNNSYMINAYDVDNSSVSWDGLTSWSFYYGSDGRKYFNWGTNLRLNNHYTKNYTATTIKGLAAHEFGHALGLDDRSSGCEIMNGTTASRCGLSTPQTDDVNGIKALY